MAMRTRIEFPVGLRLRPAPSCPPGVAFIDAAGIVYANALTVFKITHGGRPPFWSRCSAGALAVEREQRRRAREGR